MAVSPLLHCYTLTHFVLSFLAADFINASVKVEVFWIHNRSVH